MSLKFTKTRRGLPIVRFKDCYGSHCSLQKSSLPSEKAIWLGVDEPFDRSIDRVRMHLTQDMVRDLLPALQRFAETGEITE
ncbi:MAG: hypothetical protein KME20_26895 [Kaiparowitsia implicata GSE-PSE-MK54-09C]|jgi:hypothetical protein|nr:hypothetical protein [Kaiparowitsia implicata GSE-PSE-MK54-09C]